MVDINILARNPENIINFYSNDSKQSISVGKEQGVVYEGKTQISESLYSNEICKCIVDLEDTPVNFIQASESMHSRENPTRSVDSYLIQVMGTFHILNTCSYDFCQSFLIVLDPHDASKKHYYIQSDILSLTNQNTNVYKEKDMTPEEPTETAEQTPVEEPVQKVTMPEEFVVMEEQTEPSMDHESAMIVLVAEEPAQQEEESEVQPQPEVEEEQPEPEPEPEPEPQAEPEPEPEVVAPEEVKPLSYASAVKKGIPESVEPAPAPAPTPAPAPAPAPEKVSITLPPKEEEEEPFVPVNKKNRRPAPKQFAIFMKNLDDTITTEMVAHELSFYGDDMDIKLIEGKPYGFINFTDEKLYRKVLNENKTGLLINEKIIELEPKKENNKSHMGAGKRQTHPVKRTPQRDF